MQDAKQNPNNKIQIGTVMLQTSHLNKFTTLTHFRIKLSIISKLPYIQLRKPLKIDILCIYKNKGNIKIYLQKKYIHTI